jgi:hypothetical protein
MAMEVIEGEVVGGLARQEAAGMIMTPGQAKQHLRQLQEFVKEVMVPDVDFGVIPGTGNKPTLLKPGAEKLNEVYGYAPHVEIMEKDEDWKEHPPFFNYTVKCSLISKRTGVTVAEGVGSCNSMEVKYRYRTEKAWDGKPGGDGWEQKKTQRGKVYWQKRVLNEETADLANTILKMAKKRALVDATLSATRSSELFTQDIEDIESLRESATKDDGEQSPPSGGAVEPALVCADCSIQITAGQRDYSTRAFGRPLCPAHQDAAKKASGNGHTITDPDAAITDKQIGYLAKLFAQKGLSEAKEDNFLQTNFEVQSKKQLTKGQASDAIDMLNHMPDAEEQSGKLMEGE